jgi:hypothetical protein
VMESDWRRSFERLLRKLLQYPNNPAVVLLHSFRWTHPQVGRGPMYASCMQMAPSCDSATGSMNGACPEVRRGLTGRHIYVMGREIVTDMQPRAGACYPMQDGNKTQQDGTFWATAETGRTQNTCTSRRASSSSLHTVGSPLLAGRRPSAPVFVCSLMPCLDPLLLR